MAKKVTREIAKLDYTLRIGGRCMNAGTYEYDVVILGAGVTGCAAARFLSRYKGKFCVLEREEDVCCGTSKANSAIVHAGFDAHYGSQKAKYNVLGSRMMESLAAELDFPYRRNGSLVVSFSQEDTPKLEALLENGHRNGVAGLQILNRDTLQEREPNLSPDVVAALWAPTGAIVCPFGLTIALAENAAENGVEFRMNTQALHIYREAGLWRIQTNRGSITTRCVINAAGVYADVFRNQVSSRKLHITPRKGEYCLLDKSAGGIVSSTIFQLPSVKGKGVLVTPTVHGNLLVGPTAQDIEDKEGINTTSDGLARVLETGEKSVPNLPRRQIITSFAGLRACEDGGDFVIGEAEDAPGFFDCAGIQSPGLSSAPAIGLDLAEQVAKKLCLPENKEFNPVRKGILNPRTLSFEERAALIRKEPAYGQIICRCEQVSEGEIVDAIRRNPGARSLDGVKRRTRSGMGRCQGGFCSPRVMEILARELGVSQRTLTKSGGNSYLIAGVDKDTLTQEKGESPWNK